MVTGQMVFRHKDQKGGDYNGFPIFGGLIYINNEQELETLKQSKLFQRGRIVEFNPAEERKAEIEAQEREALTIRNANPILDMFETEQIAEMTNALLPEDFNTIKANILELVDFRLRQMGVKIHSISQSALPQSTNAEASSKENGSSGNVIKAAELTPENFDAVFNQVATNANPSQLASPLTPAGQKLAQVQTKGKGAKKGGRPKKQ